MNVFFKKLIDTSSEHKATWKYHLWASLFFFLTVSTFGLNFNYFWRTIFLVQRYPLHIFGNWILVFSISYLVALLIRRKTIHFAILFAFFLLFAHISKGKYEAVGFPLIAIDLSLSKYSDVFYDYLNLKTFGLVAYAILLPVLFMAIHRKGKPSLYQKMMAFPKLSPRDPRSLLCFILALPIWFGIIHLGHFRIAEFRLETRPHLPDTDYLGNGDIVAFALSLYNNRNTLEQYKMRPELLEKVLAEQSTHAIDPSCKTKEQPDVLVVMVESMFDPVQIPKVKFSQDPLGPLRGMGFEESKSFFFVPSYGGQTANTEFEFLTGSTHRFFPQGTVQYQHNIYAPANSLARMLEYKNYHAMAIHNFRRNFWRRNLVYPFLGFKEFYGLEDIRRQTSVEMYSNRKKPQDKALAKFVPDQMKKHIKEPGFYFVVTMGTHGPYMQYLSEAGDRVSLTTDVNLEADSKKTLKNYSNFLADSSDALSDLFRYALGRSKPTVVVFFGDHLPGLPMETYVNTGYFSWMKRELNLPSDEQKVVPIRVLNNFGCKIKMPKTIASNCMASHLIAQLYPDLPHDTFWKYNHDFCQKHPLLYDNTDPNKLSGDMADYASMIYENLFNFEKSSAR